ncbi:MAG: hypothetical protein J6C82_01180 [Clostridia bacterium]|nr:hypothetical protein [Clostridia bacterium]
MKKFYATIAAVALTATCTAQAFASTQVLDITKDGNWYAGNNMNVEVDTNFVEGKSLLKLTRPESATDATTIYFSWNGFDNNGEFPSIDNKYAIMDYYYKTQNGNLTGNKSTFQVDKFKQITDGAETDPGLNSSGFISNTETAICANEWAPILIPLNNSKLEGYRSTYSGIKYYTTRCYPSRAAVMSTDDALYIGNITYYTEKPSNAVYNPSLTYDNSVLSGSARLYQFSDAAKGCAMILAQYDDAGNLTGCSIKEYTAAELTAGAFNDISISMSYVISEDNNAKMFIWDGISDIAPLCESVSASYEAPITYGTDNELSYDSFGISGAVVTE